MFYTFDFTLRQLPPPPGNLHSLNVLFALPIQSRSIFSMQFTKFIFHIAADIRSVTTGMKLWDLTFRIDRNHVFGTLQFETLDRHDITQILIVVAIGCNDRRRCNNGQIL